MSQRNASVNVGLRHQLGILSYFAQLGKKGLYCVNHISSYASNPVSTTKCFSGSFTKPRETEREIERVNLV